MIFMHIPELGDCIGAESCVDLKPLDGAEEDSAESSGGGGGGRGIRRRKEVKAAGKEFPPQISSLTRSENLPPWVMRKYYLGDGRLVIKEEKVKRHEYFRAHRADGRLVMSLVPAEDEEEGGEEDQGDGSGDQEQTVDCGGNAEAAVTEGQRIDYADGKEISDLTVEDAFPEHCKYNRIGVNPCGGGLSVALSVTAAPPPLHT